MSTTIITIMPDYGQAWGWCRSDNHAGIGGNCAGDRHWGGPGDVSEGLLKEFESWQAVFDTARPHHAVDWPRFHDKGIKLAQQLRKVLPGDIRLFYEKPVEDPERNMLGWECPGWLVEIMLDGQAREIVDFDEMKSLREFYSEDLPRPQSEIQRRVTIQAECGRQYGDGWAWLGRKGQRELGICVGSENKWAGETEILDNLLGDFAAWHERFEKGFTSDDFDWTSFEKQGIELAKRLRGYLPESTPLYYMEPCNCFLPGGLDAPTGSVLEILLGGGVKEVKFPGRI